MEDFLEAYFEELENFLNKCIQETMKVFWGGWGGLLVYS